MPRRLPSVRLAAVVALLVAAGPAMAQTKPLTSPPLPQTGAPVLVTVPRDTTPPQPGAAQPTLPMPKSWPMPKSGPMPKTGMPVVEGLMPKKQGPRVERKAALPRKGRGRHVARRYRGRLERPALAGVELVAPLPAPGEPPHITTPTPAYPLESFAAAITTPPPPIRCHPARRDPYAPDPHLYRERPVVCEPDNP